MLAAASLTEAFTALAEQYEAVNDGSEVVLNFAASSTLAAQIEAGAPADVFASADVSTMDRIVGAGMAEGGPLPFAGNVLEIALPRGNPGDVNSLTDLSRRDLAVAACDPEVPCGNAAALAFEDAGIEPSIASYEPDVKAVLTKVELGEVDAGVVYRTDVLAAGDTVEGLPIPNRLRRAKVYPITLLRDADNPEGGREFIDLVLGDTGRAELERWGFRSR